MKKYIVIEGMVCQGCEKRIKKAVESLDFVRQVKVDAKLGCAIVKMPVEVPDEVLQETIENAGYKVKSIERLLCGCKEIREADIKALIESGIDTLEAIIEKTGLGTFGCCSQEIVPLLIDKYKNGKDIDIQAAVFMLNKKKDYVIAVNDAKKQRKELSKDDNTVEEACCCH